MTVSDSKLSCFPSRCSYIQGISNWVLIIKTHTGSFRRKKRKYQKEFWERTGNDQSKLVSFWVLPRCCCPASLWVRGRAVADSASGSVRFFKRISCYTVTHILPTPWTTRIQCADTCSSHQGLLMEPISYCIRPCMAFELFMGLVSWCSMVRNQRGACPGTELLLSRQLY